MLDSLDLLDSLDWQLDALDALDGVDVLELVVMHLRQECTSAAGTRRVSMRSCIALSPMHLASDEMSVWCDVVPFQLLFPPSAWITASFTVRAPS